jgi:hypothetical protein
MARAVSAPTRMDGADINNFGSGRAGGLVQQAARLKAPLTQEQRAQRRTLTADISDIEHLIPTSVLAKGKTYPGGCAGDGGCLSKT